jgi:hypothetical protein
MNQELLKELLGDLVALLVVGGVCFLMGGVFCLRVMRTDAVNNGHAEYFINADSEKDFRWKTNRVHEKE